MDPAQSKPKLNPAAGKNHRRPQPGPPVHPHPDPAVTPPPSTIQNISHRFSRLYANHKKQASKPGPHFRTRKDPSFPPVSDSSCTTLTKSSSHKVRNQHEKEKDDCLEKMVDFKKDMNGVEEGNRRSSISSVPPVASGGGRRRSFCNSQVELADFLACSGVKVVAVDMPPFMQAHAVDCARKAHDSLEKFTSKTLAYTLKKEFDGVYGPAWHCIVGTSFGSFVTHSVGGFMYFSMDHKLYILLFKTTVQKAE